MKSLVSHIDKELNCYVQESEISMINKYGYKDGVSVSPETVELLERAIFYGDVSEGLFDVTFIPLQELYGFGARNYRIPTKEEIEEAKKLVNYKYIQIDNDSSKVKLAKEGVRINLSGIIKGYTLDKVSDFLLNKGIDEYYLNFGGNILVKGNVKKIGVKHPRKDEILLEVPLMNSSISTSADYQQYFEKDDKRFTHIVNPKTGSADFPWQSAVVISKKAIDADFLSTYLFISGKDKCENVINNHFPESGFIFIENENAIFKFNVN